MTNKEKYLTAKERADAFRKFCEKLNCGNCNDCPLDGLTYECQFYWLDLEAEDNKSFAEIIEAMRKKMIDREHSPSLWVWVEELESAHNREINADKPLCNANHRKQRGRTAPNRATKGKGIGCIHDCEHCHSKPCVV